MGTRVILQASVDETPSDMERGHIRARETVVHLATECQTTLEDVSIKTI